MTPKLGILVVYLVSPGNDWVLEKHLRHIARTEPFMNFTVYAAVNRLPTRYHRLLQAFHYVKVVPLPSVTARNGAEHGTYLDLLAREALADGCDYICTFDVDSWPIRDEWIRISYQTMLQERSSAVAILRAENGDSMLPHPSFTFIEAALFRDPRCRYWVEETKRDPGLRRFLSAHKQHCDTGATLGYFLESHQLPWVKLLRSNEADYHYLMGGLYGDYIFHLGASSRQRIVFRKDDIKPLVKLVHPLASLPIAWRLAPKAMRLVKTSYEPFVRRRNRRTFDAIAGRLQADEPAFYRELRGGCDHGS